MPKLLQIRPVHVFVFVSVSVLVSVDISAFLSHLLTPLSTLSGELQLPEPVGSILATGCVSIATAQTAMLIVMSFYFSDVFIVWCVRAA